MPKEWLLPTKTLRKVSERKPKIWVRRTPYEGNPAVIIKIEEWEKEIGVQDFAVDVKLGVIYAIRGSKWERMTLKADMNAEKVPGSTPIVGPIDQTVTTPSSRDPVPIAESTRKEPPIYTNTPYYTPPEEESLPRPPFQHAKSVPTPKEKLDFESISDREEEEQIQKDIKEVQKAEAALVKERNKIEKERKAMLAQQQAVSKERLVVLRQQRKQLEDSIAQMSREIAQDSEITHKDRLSRRQNILNEYQNQIEREDQFVEDFIDHVEEKKEISMDTMTTDSTLSSTADPIEFMDEAAMMKIKN